MHHMKLKQKKKKNSNPETKCSKPTSIKEQLVMDCMHQNKTKQKCIYLTWNKRDWNKTSIGLNFEELLCSTVLINLLVNQNEKKKSRIITMIYGSILGVFTWIQFKSNSIELELALFTGTCRMKEKTKL